VDPSSQYTINAPDVVAEDFDGQTVILNLANGHYFSLRGTAATIWSSLLAGHTPESILASIRAGRPELFEESRGFLERLVELKLVRPQATGASSPTGPIDETWSAEGPQIDVFDDLAELIFADPIHDVDEQAGWPTPRPTR
jgi:hypothetical protein